MTANQKAMSCEHSKEGVRALATPIGASSAITNGDAIPRFTAHDQSDASASLIAYQRDFAERSILFLDALRQRADNLLEHERLGLPALLDFKWEMLIDARAFEHPANYALLRITEAHGHHAETCLQTEKPPVLIVDPRAGHGPGIGGFKRESEVGMALLEGHPVYFVIFFPEPCEGQTLADVLHALRRFVEEVARRHPGKPPILYGNCQAGWAITLLSADCHGLVGPAVLNGSPVSYWAGESGFNPARLAAGLLGGVWLTHFLADLGNGRLDGAWLAQNFETLKPGNALWDKYANLFSHIDTERERFLDFERWWSGFHSLSREEILAIVENLFIGDQLEQGVFRVCANCFADLRKIKNPLVIFASYGDNITPPHQALGWIPFVYKNTEDLKAAGQRIIYLTNPHVGHLGIFVSASIARFEHRAILEGLDDIAALPPGLYEMKIENPGGDPDCHRPKYSVRFEPRDVSELKFDYPVEAFERVRAVSQIGNLFYSTFVSPWVKALSNPWTANYLRWMHPMRTSRYLLSEQFSPWMYGVAELARMVEKGRTPLAETNSFLVREREAAKRISTALDEFRAWRDVAEEQVFALLYGSQPGIRRQGKESANREHMRVMDGAVPVIQDMQLEIQAAEGKMAEP
ncbi:poly(3-hydroxyalkanoate) synthetase [Methylocystis sp. MitZ-2018]|nr:poly(3-hydroxyalkanoate) synthetase [Methylocystis sp. MitZ-2018]